MGNSLRVKKHLQDPLFHEDAQGLLWVWALPEEDDEEITDRYLTVVDVGGRTAADWSI